MCRVVQEWIAEQNQDFGRKEEGVLKGHQPAVLGLVVMWGDCFPEEEGVGKRNYGPRTTWE